MKKTQGERLLAIMLFVAMIGAMLSFLPIPAAKAAADVVYDTFDDYDSDYDRQGRKGGNLCAD